MLVSELGEASRGAGTQASGEKEGLASLLVSLCWERGKLDSAGAPGWEGCG